jgi:hypothetical protein
MDGRNVGNRLIEEEERLGTCYPTKTTANSLFVSGFSSFTRKIGLWNIILLFMLFDSLHKGNHTLWKLFSWNLRELEIKIVLIDQFIFWQQASHQWNSRSYGFLDEGRPSSIKGSVNY